MVCETICKIPSHSINLCSAIKKIIVGTFHINDAPTCTSNLRHAQTLKVSLMSNLTQKKSPVNSPTFYVNLFLNQDLAFINICAKILRTNLALYLHWQRYLVKRALSAPKDDLKMSWKWRHFHSNITKLFQHFRLVLL